MPLAYSYLRFSSPQQATGDSLRRQEQAREAWLATRPKVRLDTSLKMTDAGRSAFRRKNWDTYALARFVEHIKAGRVEPGSYLLVENLDRVSREDAGEATELFLSIVNKGVAVVQLSPVVMEFRRPVNVQSLMFAIVELSRGHSESAIKSERGRAAWARKQREAASRIVTRKLPGWVRCEDEKLVLDKPRAAVVRRMFEMAVRGYGVSAIARQFNEEGVPVMGRTVMKGRPVAWSGTNVWHILRTPAAVGEYHPFRGKKGDAPPAVPNYYPPVVDRDTYHAAAAALATRHRVGRGRRGKHFHLFAGLLRDARDGGSLSYWTNGGHPTVLIPVNAKEGRKVKWATFPAGPFEDAVLSKLAEIGASEIEGGEDAGRKAESLAGQLAEAENLVRVWTAKMDDPEIADTVAAKLTEYSARRRRLAADLAAARGAAAAPVAETWGEFRSLAGLLRDDPSEDLRVRVRAALRRSIDRVTCLFVPRGRTRWAAVRIDFAGGKTHRDYLIFYKMAANNGASSRPASWDVLSFADPDKGTSFDLRSAKSVAKLEKFLAAADPADIAPVAE